MDVRRERRSPIRFALLVLTGGLLLLAGIQWWQRQPVRTIQASGSVQALAVSPAGQVFASAEYGMDRGSVIHLRRFADGTIVRTFAGGADILSSVAISPDATTLAAGSLDTRIRLWSLEDATALRTLSGHTERVMSIAFSPDGQFLASGSTDYTVRVWRVRDGTLLHTLRRTGEPFVHPQVTFHPAGDLLVGDYQSITLWSVSDGQVRHTLPNLAVNSLAVSADGRFVIVGQSTPRREVLMVQLPDWVVVATKDEHANGVHRVATSPTGRLAASASGTAGNWLEREPSDPTIRIWDLPTGSLIRTMTAHNAAIEGLAFSPDGRWLVSGSADATIKVWRVPAVAD